MRMGCENRPRRFRRGSIILMNLRSTLWMDGRRQVRSVSPWPARLMRLLFLFTSGTQLEGIKTRRSGLPVPLSPMSPYPLSHRGVRNATSPNSSLRSWVSSQCHPYSYRNKGTKVSSHQAATAVEFTTRARTCSAPYTTLGMPSVVKRRSRAFR
jgi:hypothetical protein